MLEHHHDLWLSAFVRNGETLLAFGLAGCPGLDAPLAAVPLAQGHGLVVAVLEAFLDLATPEQTRMRHLAVDKLLSRLSLPLLPVDDFKRPPSGALLHLGSYPQAQNNQFYVAAIAPLGRLDSKMLTGVAQLANEYGDGTLRFTPWPRCVTAQRRKTSRRDPTPGATGLPLHRRSTLGPRDRLYRFQRLWQGPRRHQGRRRALGRAASRP